MPINRLLRKKTIPAGVLVLLGVVGVAAGAGAGYLAGKGGPSPVTRTPTAGPPNTPAPQTAPATSSSQPSPTTTVSSAIPMGTACKWAYPGQATGEISGSDYSIVCLGPNGKVLGGFSDSHSLNAWCTDSRHTNGKHAPSPALIAGVWVCTA
jgi:hypothetical protein